MANSKTVPKQLTPFVKGDPRINRDGRHKMKDTITFKNWSVDWLSAVIADFPKVGRETRLLLAKVIQLASDFND